MRASGALGRASTADPSACGLVPVALDEPETSAGTELPDVADGEIELHGERQADVQHCRRLGQAALLDVEVGEIAEAARVDLVDVVDRRRHDPEHPLPAAVAALDDREDAVEQPGADVQQPVVAAISGPARLPQQVSRRREVVGLHGQIGLQREGMTQHHGFVRPREDGDRVGGVSVGSAPVGPVPLVVGQRLVVRADGGHVAHLLTQAQGLGRRADRLLEPVQDVVLGGQPLQQVGPDVR